MFYSSLPDFRTYRSGDLEFENPIDSRFLVTMCTFSDPVWAKGSTDIMNVLPVADRYARNISGGGLDTDELNTPAVIKMGDIYFPAYVWRQSHSAPKVILFSEEGRTRFLANCVPDSEYITTTSEIVVDTPGKDPWGNWQPGLVRKQTVILFELPELCKDLNACLEVQTH